MFSLLVGGTKDRYVLNVIYNAIVHTDSEDSDIRGLGYEFSLIVDLREN